MSTIYQQNTAFVYTGKSENGKSTCIKEKTFQRSERKNDT